MTADRARGALAVLQDADGKFICKVPCGYIVEQTASAHKPRRIQAQRRRRAMLRRRVALTVALMTVAALLAALMPWSGSGATDKPKDTTAGTLEEVHQPTAVLLPSSGTVAEYVPNAAEGTPYIVAKAGFLLQAVIMPYDVINQQFVESLQDLTRECEFSLSEKERREREARDRFTFTEPEQCSLNVDPNTGEVVEGSEVADE